MTLDIGLLIMGLAVLIVGGEFLVKGAVGVAEVFKISPLVIGMTVVSFGTSAPELLVSLKSGVNGNPGIAIGNVVGSNIANIALVLGVTVLIFPIFAGKQTKRIDWPMMVLATILFVVFSATGGGIVFWEGACLLSILVVFTIYLIRKSRKETKSNLSKAKDVPEGKKIPVWLSSLYLFLGLVGLYFGSEWLVGGAVNIADSLGMEQHIIGLTIVAFGTSAPELVASAVAAYRKQTDIALGNLIGSNLFNMMAVIGITGMVCPVAVDPAILHFDFWWMGGIAVGLGLMLFIGRKIGKLKGLILLLTYVLYIVILVLRAKGINIFC
ncbi:MAG: calcium/sodium antiporter [Flavobacteriales bacterium]|nr:calcium/sodium antiporter [Flavobacteriales bacterium]